MAKSKTASAEGTERTALPPVFEEMALKHCPVRKRYPNEVKDVLIQVWPTATNEEKRAMAEKIGKPIDKIEKHVAEFLRRGQATPNMRGDFLQEARQRLADVAKEERRTRINPLVLEHLHEKLQRRADALQEVRQFSQDAFEKEHEVTQRLLDALVEYKNL